MAGGEDLLSLLPDDVLRLILICLPSAAAAARTSLLSRRWRHLWAHLLELCFPLPTDLARVRAALAAHATPDLRRLHVAARNAAPDATAAVLLLAAPRLTGELFFHNVIPGNQKGDEEEEAGKRGAVDFPCFEKAAEISLRLGYLRFVLPPSGVFAKLTALRLDQFRFDGRCELGDVVSSARCPSLRKLSVYDTRGLSNLAIYSESLLHVDLHNLDGLQKLTVVAPMLRFLDVFCCFIWRHPVADISAPVLGKLQWIDAYDPSSVHLGEMGHLRALCTFSILVYGPPIYPYNSNSATLLQHFKAIPILELLLAFPNVMANSQYLMEAITMLPDIEFLVLVLSTRGHAFGPCVFHLLRMCTSIRKLRLTFGGDIKAQTACSSGCICDQPQNWETEDIFLNFLLEVEISYLKGVERVFAFVKRLLRWAPMLKTITVVSTELLNLVNDKGIHTAHELCFHCKDPVSRVFHDETELDVGDLTGID